MAEVRTFLATLPQDPFRCVVKPVQSAGTDDGTLQQYVTTVRYNSVCVFFFSSLDFVKCLHLLTFLLLFFLPFR